MISCKCVQKARFAWYQMQHASVSTSDQDPGGQLKGAPSRHRRSKLPPRRGAGPANVAWALDSLLGSVHTIPPLQRPSATSTMPCEFLRVGKKGSPMMLNYRLRLRCAVSLAVQTRDQVILRRLGRV